MAVTADVKGTAILRNKVADYLNTEPGGESPAYHLMNVFETIDENPNAQVVEKHYIVVQRRSSHSGVIL